MPVGEREGRLGMRPALGTSDCLLAWDGGRAGGELVRVEEWERRSYHIPRVGMD